MSIRRVLLGLLTAAPLLLGSGAIAAEHLPYTPAAFETARKAGRPMLVHVTAPWCTVCAAQKSALSRLEADPRFKDLTVFHIDFDSQKDAVRRFGATMQSTLIVYKGDEERGRSVGETQPEWIESLVEKAL